MEIRENNVLVDVFTSLPACQPTCQRNSDLMLYLLRKLDLTRLNALVNAYQTHRECISHPSTRPGRLDHCPEAEAATTLTAYCSLNRVRGELLDHTRSFVSSFISSLVSLFVRSSWLYLKNDKSYLSEILHEVRNPKK